MNTLFIYLLSFLLFANAIYHFWIRQECIYVAQLTKGMKGIALMIPIIFLGLAYSVGNGLVENMLVALAASLSMISRIVGQGISEKGIYYWTRTGVNRLARWEAIQKVNINYSRHRLEKIRLETYASYPNQLYRAEEFQKIAEDIQRRI